MSKESSESLEDCVLTAWVRLQLGAIRGVFVKALCVVREEVGGEVEQCELWMNREFIMLVPTVRRVSNFYLVGVWR